MPYTGANPTDIAVATCLDNSLKQCAITNALSACECANPDLRAAFTQISQMAIQRQEQLSALMAQKGWYVAPPVDEDTVNHVIPQLQAAVSGLNLG